MSKKSDTNIIAFVMGARQRTIDQVRAAMKEQNKQVRIMYICDSRTRLLDGLPEPDILISCDFSQPRKIAEAILPYEDELLAITCRFEQSIARFQAVIPHVPYLRTPTTESLGWATDKYEMRKRFQLHAKAHNPRFTWVKKNTKAERIRVISKIQFPMVIKPTNLAASMFVSICYHEEDLERSLRTIFRKIKAAYKKDARMEEPKVLAEEYIEGDLYSIDSYVNSRGEVYHCPLVRQSTARDIGHDDFYNYMQITPTNLKKSTVAKAEAVAEAAIHSLGLRSMTAHTELMKIDDEWKIVEVGPRPGGMRDQLYGLSCDINHAMNDIAIRIPRQPIVPKKCKGFAAYLKFFADKEGEIVETRGIKKLEELKSFHSIVINQKVGDRAVFSRNGGRAVFTTVLYNKDRSALLADIRRIEQMVDIVIESVADKKRASKQSAKKATTAQKSTKKVTKPVSKQSTKKRS